MPPEKIKLLVVAAYPPELKPFCSLGRRHFVIKKNIAYLAAGIGPVAATFGLTHFLEDYRPEKIIGIGTAGVIRKFKIGEIVVGKKVFNGSSLPLSLDPSSQRERGKFPHVNIFAPQEVSRTEEQRVQLEQSGYDVENLEAYAFAFVAKKFRIPFVSLLGLTNFVGPKGHKEWKKNEQKVMYKLAKQVCQIVSKGKPKPLKSQ